MRKLLFILFLVPCMVSAQSITLTGVDKNCQTGANTLAIIGGGQWDYTRHKSGDLLYYNKDKPECTIYVADPAAYTRIRRIGILFNNSAVTALGDITITAISLRLYCNSLSSLVGTTIYSAPYTYAGTGNSNDYSRAVGAKYTNLSPKPFDKVGHSTSTVQGYNTFSLGTAYVQSQQYSNMVSYGVGEYEHDYLDVMPLTATIYELEFAINRQVNSGLLVSGALYMITDNSGGANFISAGAANNNVGTIWTYISGIVVWGSGELYKNPPQLIINYTTTPAPSATATKTTFIF